MHALVGKYYVMGVFPKSLISLSPGVFPMAKTTRMGLFVERFVAYNLDRYADNPTMHALFVGLTEPELAFEDMVLAVNGVRSSTIKCRSRNFVGYNQRWTAAELNDPNAYTMTDYQVADNLAVIQAKSTPGLYAYKEADGFTVKVIVLVPRNTAVSDRPSVAKAMFIEALRFDIMNKDLSANATKIVVNAPCMYGDIAFDIAADTIVQIVNVDYGQLTHPEDLEV